MLHPIVGSDMLQDALHWIFMSCPASLFSVLSSGSSCSESGQSFHWFVPLLFCEPKVASIALSTEVLFWMPLASTVMLLEVSEMIFKC